MGERKKRKSLWDEEAEPKSFPGTSANNYLTGREQHSGQSSELYHEISASGSHGAQELRDYSGQPSLDSIEKDPVAQMNDSFTESREDALEVKEIDGKNSYYQNMSPDFKHNQSHENDRSHSRRYPGRGRSRSRSRTRGRCRSRSSSRGRERARGRSRSRSRSEDDARGRTESQSSGRIHRRSQTEMSTKICSDFSAGRCRRGSQCEYLHPKDTSHRDGGADTSESWRSRASHGNDSKQSYGRGPQAEDEKFQNKSKSGVPCKDLMIGKCRWGDSCRFSHHFASGETSVEGTKHFSLDKDTENQPYRNRKPLCKYFAAGKCDRDNCRFSHEDSKSNSLVGGHGEVIHDRCARGNINRRNGLGRDDPGSTIDNSSTGHGSRFSHGLGNVNIRGLPQQTDNLEDKNNKPASHAVSGSYGRDLGTTASVGKENITAKQELLVFHGLQVQNQDENMTVEGQNNLQVDPKISVNAWQQNHGVVESTSFHGQNTNQNGENVHPGNSCLSEEAGSEQMPALNGAEMRHFTSLNLQTLIQKHQNAIQVTGMPEMSDSQSFRNMGFSEHSAQPGSVPLSVDLQQVAPVNNPVVFPNQTFENEHSGKSAVEEISNSTGIASSISNASVHVPLENTTDTQFNPIAVSRDLPIPIKNGISKNEHGHQLAEDTNIPAGQLFPAGQNNLEVNHSGSLKLHRETAPENPDFDEVKRVTAEHSEGVQNSMHLETLDNHGKGDEIIANKDDKDMRLFKNALIEFVKDILKPTWKEGRMSREVYKTIVKKVVNKITSTIQTDHIPKTQERVEQYLSFSKPKIAKLVQAYVDRCLKPDS